MSLKFRLRKPDLLTCWGWKGRWNLLALASVAACPPTPQHGHAWIPISRGRERQRRRSHLGRGLPGARVAEAESGSGGKRWSSRRACAKGRTRTRSLTCRRALSSAAPRPPPRPRVSLPAGRGWDGSSRNVARPGGWPRLLSNADGGHPLWAWRLGPLFPPRARRCGTGLRKRVERRAFAWGSRA